MIILDANVLIAYLDANDAHHVPTRDLLVEHATSRLWTSPISRAEALVQPARLGRLGDAEAALELLGAADVALPPDAPVRLAALRAQTGCRLPDCHVLLAAQQVGGRVATFDAALARAASDADVEVLRVGK